MIELKSRIDELMREKEHISLLVEERDKDVEQLQTMLSTENKTLELRLKEVKDNVEWWKRRADNMKK